MGYGNVLVVGNSGVGKSTLINAVLGEELAVVGGGDAGVTQQIEVFESTDDKVPFRIIDTIGFEPSRSKRRIAISAVKKWSREAARAEGDDTDINVIWFCVEGTSKKLFPEAIEDLVKATDLWEGVPVIVVITKSYSQTEREENVAMVRDVFARRKNGRINLKEVIPVVAQAYPINETTVVAPDGIDELIDATNRCMPEGKQAATRDIAAFKMRRKRTAARGIIGSFAAAGATVGAVPFPISDALILTPIEIAELNALATLYEVQYDDTARELLDAIVEVGTVSVAAKAVINALKSIPGVNLTAGVLNAITAGALVAGIGQGAAKAFEQLYLGEKSLEDLGWARKLAESILSSSFIDKVGQVIAENAGKGGAKSTQGVITDIVKVALS